MLLAVLNIVLSVSLSEPLRIAVVDTGLSLKDPRFSDVLCKSGHKDFTGRGIEDNHGHGTFIAGLIKEYAGNFGYCLMILKYYNTSDSSLQTKAFEWAVNHGANIINFSGGGEGANENEYLIIRNSPTVLYVVAAGNDHRDVKYYYPAAYKLNNVVAVGALRSNGVDRLESSNFGPQVLAWEIGENVQSTLPHGMLGRMSGTSMACAIRTGKLVKQAVSIR